MKFLHISIFLLLIFAIACSSGTHSGLKRVASLADDNPELARKVLDSIDYNSLCQNDRYFYNLLDIKTKDKLYITHTSDSLILDVVDFYSRHQSSGNYPEALYYAGRVLSDIGDYPSSLKYFQQALDLLPHDTPYVHLRGSVLSQTGRMLNTLRLYREAVPYIRSAIEIDSIENNPVNTYYDYQLLGSLYMNMDKCDTAEMYYRKAYGLAPDYPPMEKASLRVYLAAIHEEKGEIDSALSYIRELLMKSGRTAGHGHSLTLQKYTKKLKFTIPHICMHVNYLWTLLLKIVGSDIWYSRHPLSTRRSLTIHCTIFTQIFVKN